MLGSLESPWLSVTSQRFLADINGKSSEISAEDIDACSVIGNLQFKVLESKNGKTLFLQPLQASLETASASALSNNNLDLIVEKKSGPGYAFDVAQMVLVNSKAIQEHLTKIVDHSGQLLEIKNKIAKMDSVLSKKH
jgi:hypothetical protein